MLSAEMDGMYRIAKRAAAFYGLITSPHNPKERITRNASRSGP